MRRIVLVDDLDFSVAAFDDLTAPNLLQPVWRDGKLLKNWTFDEVRANAQLAEAEHQRAA
jgi:nicotinamide phosphoribosyltransferase